jgi:hypothetical protein
MIISMASRHGKINTIGTPFQKQDGCILIDKTDSGEAEWGYV